MQAVIFYWILIVGAARNKNQWKLGKPSSTQPQQKINPWNILQPIFIWSLTAQPLKSYLPRRKKRLVFQQAVFQGLLLAVKLRGCVFSFSPSAYPPHVRWMPSRTLPSTLPRWRMFWGELPVSCDWWVFPQKKCFGKVFFFRTRVIYSFSNFFYLTVAVIPAVERSKHPKIAWNSTWRLLRGRFLLSADTGFHVSTLRQMVTLQ